MDEMHEPNEPEVATNLPEPTGEAEPDPEDEDAAEEITTVGQDVTEHPIVEG
jgi:hypothetical protein